MTTKYYLPLNSNGLGHYFSRALIVPAKYLINKPEDIQNRFSNSILISTQKWFKDCDCSIELILTTPEIKSLKAISKNCYLYYQALPISRINAIFFSDKSQKETTLWNINNGAAFIPERLVFIENVQNPDSISEQEQKHVDSATVPTDLTDKIRRYDIIMGGLAFMKVGRDVTSNFSLNYFATLSFFNQLIEEQSIFAYKNFGWNFNQKYIGLFSKSDSEWSKYRDYIFQNIELNDIEILAAKENIKVEKRLGLIRLDSINHSSILFDLAVLATYGENKNKSTDNLVSDITSGNIPANKAEEVALLFGLNNGYSKLRNKYKDAKNEFSVKFNLDSKLDYYTIESIYQFVFSDLKKSYSFNYIDEKFKFSPVKYAPAGYETFNILDTVVIAKKKKTALEGFFDILYSDYYEKLARLVGKWYPPFAPLDIDKAKSYFKSELSSSIENAAKSFQKQLEAEFEAKLLQQKENLNELHRLEIDKLRTELGKQTKSEESTIVKVEGNVELTEYPINQNMDEINEPGQGYDIPANDGDVHVDKYKSLSLEELRKLAKEQKIKGFSKKNREELIAILKSSTTSLF